MPCIYQPSLRFHCGMVVCDYLARNKVLSHSSEQNTSLAFINSANTLIVLDNDITVPTWHSDEYLLHWPSFGEVDLSTICVKETYHLRA